MSGVLVISDLNAQVNNEPRVSDLKLGFSLGMKNPASTMRKLVDRHRDALERFGLVLSTVEKTLPQGGRPGKAYWLNKKQALYLCTKSEAPAATETTIAMVEVFDAWQSRQGVNVSAPSLPRGHMTLRVGQREVVVDVRDYRIGPRDEAVVCGHDGKVHIMRGPLDPTLDAPWLGARSVMGKWKKPGPNTMLGVSKERHSYIVFGRLVGASPCHAMQAQA